MSQKRKGIIISYINLFFKNILALVYVPILLKYLGKSEYGLYQMANSIISSLIILNLGFTSSYVRFYSIAKYEQKSKENVSKLNGFYLILFILISLLSFLIGIILTYKAEYFFSDSLTVSELIITKKLMILLLFNVAISFISTVFDCYILANEKFYYQKMRQLMQTILVPFFTIPLLMIGYKSVSIVIVQTIITLFFLFLNINYSRKNLGMSFQFRGIELSYFTSIFTFSFFIFLNQLTDQINWNLPNFLLGALKGADEVAVYSIANQIKNIFMGLSTALSGVFVPEINKLALQKNGDMKLTKLMTRVGRLQFLVLSYILGGFIILGKYFIHVWAGADFSEAYFLSLLLVIPFITPLIQNVGIEIQRAKNMHIFRSILYIVSAGINIFLTIYFIKKYSVLGSSIGTLLTFTVSNGIIMNIYYQKKVGLNMCYFWKNILQLVPQFIIPVFILVRVEINNIRIFSFIGALYTMIFVGIYIFIGINTEEKLIIKNRMKRGKISC